VHNIATTMSKHYHVIVLVTGEHINIWMKSSCCFFSREETGWYRTGVSPG